MKDEHLKQIAKALKEFGEWMKESSAGTYGVSLDQLIEDSNDIYEVVVDIHLNNGDVVTLRNDCIGGLEKGTYTGDIIEDNIRDGNIIANLYVNGDDGSFHQIAMPITSICWIDPYSVQIDWKEYKRKKEQRKSKKLK